MSRNPRRVHLAASVLALALAASAAAAPPVVDRYRILERNAFMPFTSIDASGCIVTGFSATVAENATRTGPGKPEPRAIGFLYIYRYDQCHQYQTLLSATTSRELTPEEMELGSNLQSVRLTATFDLIDTVTNTPHTATVDLTWSATGPATRTEDHYSTFGPGFRYASDQQGTSRPAQGTGSVLLDSTELFSGPSTQGSISNSRSGELAIYRN
jgi:hypothetical protein